MDKSKYISPFSSRYAGDKMQSLFSDEMRVRTWRRLWISLARRQGQLGLPITDTQLTQLEEYAENIDFERAAFFEGELRHDVMAHVHAYGEQCPAAAPIIHLGATSAYVVDNGDLIIQRVAMELVRDKLAQVVANLAAFAHEHKALPTLGFTHFQPAQLTTVGKRACLWMHDLLMDLEEIDFVLGSLKFLGSKGTTGTHASFLELFDGNGGKVKELESLIACDFGFEAVYAVSGQTYSRKVDARMVNALGQVAQSAAKFANDLRLLAHLKEMEEPFESKQIGSSAMAYKRNPMRAERVNALSRYVITQGQNTAATASAQWLERTLDDSANKRIAVPESFLAIDGVLNLLINITGGLVVYPKMIHRHVMAELPFMATENIMMDGVKRGGDRQQLHEAIRVHSMAAAAQVKEQGAENDLLERIAADPAFDTSLSQLQALLNPENFTGRAVEQTEEFLRDQVQPVLDKYLNKGTVAEELKV